MTTPKKIILKSGLKKYHFTQKWSYYFPFPLFNLVCTFMVLTLKTISNNVLLRRRYNFNINQDKVKADIVHGDKLYSVVHSKFKWFPVYFSKSWMNLQAEECEKWEFECCHSCQEEVSQTYFSSPCLRHFHDLQWQQKFHQLALLHQGSSAIKCQCVTIYKWQ